MDSPNSMPERYMQILNIQDEVITALTVVVALHRHPSGWRRLPGQPEGQVKLYSVVSQSTLLLEDFPGPPHRRRPSRVLSHARGKPSTARAPRGHGRRGARMPNVSARCRTERSRCRQTATPASARRMRFRTASAPAELERAISNGVSPSSNGCGRPRNASIASRSPW